MIGKLQPAAKRGTTYSLDNVETFTKACGLRANKQEQSHVGPSRFTGTDSYAEAEQLAMNGWSEGRQKVEALTGSLVASLSSRIVREEWVADVEGAYVDLGLYVAHEPEYWRRPEEVWSDGASRKHVRILVNGSASCGVDANLIMRRGAGIAALVDLLELAGMAVTLDLVYCIRDSRSDKNISTMVTLKRADERGDPNKLVFWLAHPSALRRMMFAWWEGCSEADRRAYAISTIYGWPDDPILDAHEQQPDIYFGRMYYGESDWQSEESIRRWLEKTLADTGVHLKKD